MTTTSSRKQETCRTLQGTISERRMKGNVLQSLGDGDASRLRDDMSRILLGPSWDTVLITKASRCTASWVRKRYGLFFVVIASSGRINEFLVELTMGMAAISSVYDIDGEEGTEEGCLERNGSFCAGAQ